MLNSRAARLIIFDAEVGKKSFAFAERFTSTLTLTSKYTGQVCVCFS